MKASNYNIFGEYPETGETILFNSLYGSLSLWEQNEIEIVTHILSHPNQPNIKNSNIKTVLFEQKYLIDDSLDEIAIIENRKILGIKDKNRLDIIIIPTLECNFACSYCYEYHHPSRMTEEMEEAIKLWLTAQVPKYKVVMFHWFGGEPLIEYQRIISISRHVRTIAMEAGTSCIMHITTNGYLLNNVRVRELINSGIYDFQITLDGPPEIHDTFRPLKNGSGTFEDIFRNINNLARANECVKISLRINFNHNNLYHIPALLEMFPIDVRPHLRVVYEPIFGKCSLSATDNLPSDEISHAMSNDYTLAQQLGYDVILGTGSLDTGRLVYCYAERENQYIISYDGNIYKCSVSEFNPEERVGYIQSDGTFVKGEQQWGQWINSNLFDKKCYSCNYLPLCMGGCRKTRLQHQETGSYCSLVPTNVSYLLKQVAMGQFKDVLRKEIKERIIRPKV